MKGIERFTCWTLAGLMILAFNAAAQVNYSPLKGLSKIEILVEDLDEDATRCGLSREAIESSARFVLEQSRLRVTKKNTLDSPVIYYTFTVLTTGTGCVYGYEVSVKDSGKLETGFGKNWGYYVLWSKGGVGTAPRAATPRRVGEQVEEMTKLFLNQWAKDNPKP